MADEDQAHAAIGDEPLENIQNLRLHGDIERRGGLIRDQDIRSPMSIIAIITRWPMPPETSCG